MAITMATAASALLLAGVGIVLQDGALFRQGMRLDLVALSRIVADNTTAALSFDDPRAAAETLAALKARPHLIQACIYQPDGRLFASYLRTDADARCGPV